MYCNVYVVPLVEREPDRVAINKSFRLIRGWLCVLYVSSEFESGSAFLRIYALCVSGMGTQELLRFSPRWWDPSTPINGRNLPGPWSHTYSRLKLFLILARGEPPHSRPIHFVTSGKKFDVIGAFKLKRHRPPIRLSTQNTQVTSLAVPPVRRGTASGVGPPRFLNPWSVARLSMYELSIRPTENKRLIYCMYANGGILSIRTRNPLT